MRKRYEHQLSLLNNELIHMGACCEQLISSACALLDNRDLSQASQLKQLESELDQMEKDIEALCLKILLQQQPVAGDLRLVSAAMKMVTDMERIGDQAEDIAEIVQTMKKEDVDEKKLLQQMPQTASLMVTEAVNAFVHQDIQLAQKIIDMDDIVDEQFLQYRNSLIPLITEHPQRAETALDGLMIAKYFERIADHATNLAEWVVFAVTGTYKGEDLE